MGLYRYLELFKLVWPFFPVVWREVWKERMSRFNEAWFPWSGSAETMLNFLYWHGLGVFLSKGVSWTNFVLVDGIQVKRWKRSLLRPARMTVVLVTGLNGDETAHYVEQFIHKTAEPFDLDVFIVCNNGSKEYKATGLLRRVVDEIKLKHDDVGDNIALFGFSAGAVMCVDYAAQYEDVKFVCCLGGTYDLMSTYNYMPLQWTHLYNWYLGHRNVTRLGNNIKQDLDNIAASGKSLEDYYKSNSCTEEVVMAKVPLYTCTTMDDPLFDPREHAVLIEASCKNPLVRPTITRYGGHLGWKCGNWLNKTYLKKVFEHELTTATQH